MEIQIRTLLQQRWAEVSEKLADTIDSSIKYGGGPEETQFDLMVLSTAIDEAEDFQRFVEKCA